MDQVFIRDGYLYLEFDDYIPLSGHKHFIKKVLIKNINYITYQTGPRGGFLGWDIVGKEKYDYLDRFKELNSFGRKQHQLFEETRKILTPLEIEFIEEKQV